MDPRVQPPGDKAQRRALPGQYLDAITDGVAPQRSPRAQTMAVDRLLLRSAMSARAHGWPYTDWAGLVLDPGRVLSQQVRVRSGKAVPPTKVEQRLRKAWAKGIELSTARPWTEQERLDRAAHDETRTRTLAADLDLPLRDSERAVLAHLADLMAKRGWPTVAMPWRSVAEATGLPERTTRNALTSLQSRGLLVVHERGRPRQVGQPGRATVYRIGGAR